MAERRMISKKVVWKPTFRILPAKVKMVYFYLVLEADDDGFIEDPKLALRKCGANLLTIEVLQTHGFLIKFPSGVVAITHWYAQNRVQKDRYKKTEFQEEFSQLTLDEFGAYHM